MKLKLYPAPPGMTYGAHVVDAVTGEEIEELVSVSYVHDAGKQALLTVTVRNPEVAGPITAEAKVENTLTEYLVTYINENGRLVGFLVLADSVSTAVQAARPVPRDYMLDEIYPACEAKGDAADLVKRLRESRT